MYAMIGRQYTMQIHPNIGLRIWFSDTDHHRVGGVLPVSLIPVCGTLTLCFFIPCITEDIISQLPA